MIFIRNLIGNILKVLTFLFTKGNCCKAVLIFISFSSTAQTTIEYNLFINDTIVNYSGKSAKGIAVNGQIPAPTLEFTQGDTAVIYIHNLMEVETSIHWHGVILPNDQDGVPYLTTAPILPHSVFKYKFAITQNGTYWYHSHTNLQEQSGVYGALIFHKKSEQQIREYPLVLSDWTNEKPSEVLRSLRMASDWYAIKKHSTQNWGEAILSGHFKTKATQEWKRMFPMDVSDVYYNALLSNGQQDQKLEDLKAGDKIKLRIINGGASTYFWLNYGGGKITVVANDGNDVEPVEVDRLLIAVAETYDIIVTIPEDMSYEFKATAEDRTKSTSVWLGKGMKMPAPELPNLKYFAGMKMMNAMMNFDGSMKDMGMKMSNQVMDMNEVMYPEISGTDKIKKADKKTDAEKIDMEGMNMGTSNEKSEIVTLNYAMLKSPSKTTLPDAPIKNLTFRLTGNMNRYVWTINNIALSDTDKIMIQKGENVRIVLINESMMRHPMHLHGHDFRVLNGRGEYSPLKNMLDIMPMETDTIEFAARYDGDWFFHCHLLYHMMAGMGRVFSYQNSAPNIQVDTIRNSWNKFSRDDRMWHFSTTLSVHSQEVAPRLMLMNRKYIADAMGHINYDGDFESEITFSRYFGKNYYGKFFLGADLRKISEKHDMNMNSDDSNSDNRKVGIAGIQYLLPFFIQAELRVDHVGNIRFQVGRQDLALSSRLRAEGFWNTDKEYEIGLKYIVIKRLSISANYDSHFGGGAGLTFTY